MKRLVIMRGLPGSGKTTVARAIGGIIHSTDAYFMDGSEHRFDPTQLGQAHVWNQTRTQKAMEDGTEIIVIDNTNIRLEHMKPYIEMADKYGYKVEIMIPETLWAFDAQGCFDHCTHNVPLYAIERMLRSWQTIV